MIITMRRQAEAAIGRKGSVRASRNAAVLALPPPRRQRIVIVPDQAGQDKSDESEGRDRYAAQPSARRDAHQVDRPRVQVRPPVNGCGGRAAIATPSAQTFLARRPFPLLLNLFQFGLIGRIRTQFDRHAIPLNASSHRRWSR